MDTTGEGEGKLPADLEAELDVVGGGGLTGAAGEQGGGSSPFRYDSLSRQRNNFSTKAVVSVVKVISCISIVIVMET